MGRMQIATVRIFKGEHEVRDTEGRLQGAIAPGKHRVEMPEDYDPAQITAEDILHDEMVTIVDDEDPETLYTTWGPVRGGCGHAHQTEETAERCADRDRAGCRAQGGYSDRAVRIIGSRGEARSYDVTRGPGVATEGDTHDVECICEHCDPDGEYLDPIEATA